MKVFYFNWLELPTGRTGKGHKEFASEIEFYQAMDAWNQDKDYKYWRIL